MARPNAPSRVALDERVRDAMRRQRRRDTAPELALRRVLHRSGLRYRLQDRVPGSPRRRIDIAFRRERVAVFVQGCFWHGCGLHKTIPAHNGPWWREKLQANIDRDADTDRLLRQQGWLPIRIWEHELVTDAGDRVHQVVLERRAMLRGRPGKLVPDDLRVRADEGRR